MNASEALDKACAEVGIVPPKSYREGRWTKADTLSGKNGRGDGRVMVGGWYVVATNWQQGRSATVRLKDGELTAAEKAQIKRDMAQARADRAEAARRAAAVAEKIVAASRLAVHPYLIGKGFPAEQALVIYVDALVPILERARKRPESLIADGGRSAVVMPARIGNRITTVEMIWEDGTKKFLAGGELAGASHRIARGTDTWLCEGYATGLSLRAALRGLGRSDTILCCFSAGNVATVAGAIRGRCYIATDHDKPLPEFGGLGTGEYWARRAGKPYVMPPALGQDFNDLHQAAGIFEVQRVLSAFLRGR